jgi:hypothetical protein
MLAPIAMIEGWMMAEERRFMVAMVMISYYDIVMLFLMG